MNVEQRELLNHFNSRIYELLREREDFLAACQLSETGEPAAESFPLADEVERLTGVRYDREVMAAAMVPRKEPDHSGFWINVSTVVALVRAFRGPSSTPLQPIADPYADDAESPL